MPFGSILGPFGEHFRCFVDGFRSPFGVFVFIFVHSKSKNEKVCLDCADVGGLHVRPSTGT